MTGAQTGGYLIRLRTRATDAQHLVIGVGHHDLVPALAVD